MRYVSRSVRFFLVTVGIIALTSVSIDATDLLRGSQSALGLLARDVTTATCPTGMVEIENPNRMRFCIDAYEVSPSRECPFAVPASSVETAANANDGECSPVPRPLQLPWVQVARVQAEQLCARAGKRLPTSHEWYLAARGTPDSSASCNVNGGLTKTGASTECLSGMAVYDMVGNVWEWVAGEARVGAFEGTALPPEGFVTAVSPEGVPTATASTGDAVYNNDYLWADSVGTFALMRGGFHGSRDDAGVYTLHAAVAPEFASAAVGFRCALSL
ncbi:SUMF1/EgtB/PvdO family nonheme iron enzyme [Patescibacteria group bacterium]|nr:SUMF1/EgtB/PvdO family nonheme iron enzyme [Patescibacteria group bacterium]